MIATYSPEMERYVREAVAGGDYSLIIASQIDMAAYSRHFRDVPALLEEIELGVLYEQYASGRFEHGAGPQGAYVAEAP